jgi:hypothetical protein
LGESHSYYRLNLDDGEHCPGKVDKGIVSSPNSLDFTGRKSLDIEFEPRKIAPYSALDHQNCSPLEPKAGSREGHSSKRLKNYGIPLYPRYSDLSQNAPSKRLDRHNRIESLTVRTLAQKAPGGGLDRYCCQY